MVCELEVLAGNEKEIARRMNLKERDLSERLPQNTNIRHGFIESIDSSLPELLADFRMIWGVQSSVLYYQVGIEIETTATCKHIEHGTENLVITDFSTAASARIAVSYQWFNLRRKPFFCNRIKPLVHCITSFFKEV
jgi:hypothetical protein